MTLPRWTKNLITVTAEEIQVAERIPGLIITPAQGSNYHFVVTGSAEDIDTLVLALLAM